jgi:Mce-associated membrane protein
MPPPKPPLPALDPERTDPPRQITSAEDALAEAARAEALAEQARARATELRRQAEAARTDQRDVAPEAPTPESARTRRRWLRSRSRPGRGTVAVAAAVVLICACLGASGYLLLHHRVVDQQRQRTAQRTAEFSTAARHGVETVMSLDGTNAKETVERVINNSTGQFKEQFEDGAPDLIKALAQSKVVTKVTVNAVAVESMTDNAAVVLVAATSQASNAEGSTRQPAKFRLAVTVTRDGGQLKVSKVEFVQ